MTEKRERHRPRRTPICIDTTSWSSAARFTTSPPVPPSNTSYVSRSSCDAPCSPWPDRRPQQACTKPPTHAHPTRHPPVHLTSRMLQPPPPPPSPPPPPLQDTCQSAKDKTVECPSHHGSHPPRVRCYARKCEGQGAETGRQRGLQESAGSRFVRTIDSNDDQVVACRFLKVINLVNPWCSTRRILNAHASLLQ